MWALRRASSSFKKQGYIIGYSRISGVSNDIFCGYSEGKFEGISNVILGRSFSYEVLCKTTHESSKLFLGHRNLCSLVGTRSSSGLDGDLDDGFSEPEFSGEDTDVETSHGSLELSDSKTDTSQPESEKNKVSMKLFKAIATVPLQSVEKVMDKWVEMGNDLAKTEILEVLIDLRIRHMYGKALQLSEWLELKNQFAFDETDFVCRVDLIAKVRGLEKAECYIQKMPEAFRNETVYQILLANSSSKGDMKKSEEIFNKMRELGFPVTAFACSQLLDLYKRTDKRKIANVLLLMEKENIKLSSHIYQILIDAKGQSYDIAGMEKVVETMKDEGVEPNVITLGVMAKHYIFSGRVEKAENILKLIEAEINEHPSACRILLDLYAVLKKGDDVCRIWQLCESNARVDECMVAIEAWGKLGKVAEAEAIFDKMSKAVSKLTSKHYYPLLKVCARNKMLAKGKELIEKMSGNGFRMGPLTWDAIVKLYIESGEVEKAYSVLQKAAVENTRLKPKLSSYLAIMEQYAKRADIHGCEKMFYQMKLAGYFSRIHQFQYLIQAYVNAKTPCYGIAQRMKADNVVPTRTLAKMISKVDPFKKTAMPVLD